MNKFLLRNKITIVTGASFGIGEAIARLFTKSCAKVVLAARSKDKLRELEKQLPGSLAVPTDMTKIDQIKRMVKTTKDHFGRIDILINCAGQEYDSPVEKINLETFRRIFDLDLVGPIAAMQKSTRMSGCSKWYIVCSYRVFVY